MSNRVSALYHQQQLFAGFLGGFTMVSLVLVSQEESKYQYQILNFPKDWYFDGLITLMALTSLVLILTSWEVGYVASGLMSTSGARGRRFRRLVLFSNRIGLVLVLVVIAALMLPFSLFGCFITLFVGAALLIVFDHLRVSALREAHQELKQEQAQAEAQPDS